MNRQQAKEFFPIIKAFAEGKEIECRVEDKWYKLLEICNETNPQDYRIKPEYRPFKDSEECFEEMKKHQPFAWIKDKQQHEYFNMISICINAATTFQYDEVEYCDYQELINNYTFADGTPFGVKVME